MWGRRGNPLGWSSSPLKVRLVVCEGGGNVMVGIDRCTAILINPVTNGGLNFPCETISKFSTIYSFHWLCGLLSASHRWSARKELWDQIRQCVPQCGRGPWWLAKRFQVIYSSGCYYLLRKQFLFQSYFHYIPRSNLSVVVNLNRFLNTSLFTLLTKSDQAPRCSRQQGLAGI